MRTTLCKCTLQAKTDYDTVPPLHSFQNIIGPISVIFYEAFQRIPQSAGHASLSAASCCIEVSTKAERIATDAAFGDVDTPAVWRVTTALGRNMVRVDGLRWSNQLCPRVVAWLLSFTAGGCNSIISMHVPT